MGVPLYYKTSTIYITSTVMAYVPIALQTVLFQCADTQSQYDCVFTFHSVAHTV
jgi:hypothetical protein